MRKKNRWQPENWQPKPPENLAMEITGPTGTVRLYKIPYVLSNPDETERITNLQCEEIKAFMEWQREVSKILNDKKD